MVMDTMVMERGKPRPLLLLKLMLNQDIIIMATLTDMVMDMAIMDMERGKLMLPPDTITMDMDTDMVDMAMDMDMERGKLMLPPVTITMDMDMDMVDMVMQEREADAAPGYYHHGYGHGYGGSNRGQHQLPSFHI